MATGALTITQAFTLPQSGELSASLDIKTKTAFSLAIGFAFYQGFSIPFTKLFDTRYTDTQGNFENYQSELVPIEAAADGVILKYEISGNRGDYVIVDNGILSLSSDENFSPTSTLPIDIGTEQLCVDEYENLILEESSSSEEGNASTQTESVQNITSEDPLPFSYFSVFLAFPILYIIRRTINR